MIDKELLLHKMKQRMNALLDLYNRDYGQHPEDLYKAYWELKFWYEAALRGEFDLLKVS